MKKCKYKLIFIIIAFILTIISLIMLIVNYSSKSFVPILLLYLVLITNVIFVAYTIISEKTNIKREKSKKVENNYELLYELFTEISDVDSIRQIYDRLLVYALKAVPYASFGSVLINDGTNHFSFAAMKGNNLENFKELSLSLEELSLNTASNGKSEKAVIVENILEGNKVRFNNENKTKFFIDAAISDIHYTMSVPIYIEGELKVVINLDTTSDRIFNEDEKKYLEVFASAATPFIKLDDALSNLEYLGNHDKLTSMHNRQYFDKKMEKEFEPALENSVVLIDIDKFKKINDIYGHHVGDECLSLFSKLLVIQFPDCITARYGGDEFIIYCSGLSKMEIEKKFTLINKNCRIIIPSQHNIIFTFSYGISQAKNNKCFQDVYKEADKQMYITKRSKDDKECVIRLK